jgi:hypothetical protein
MGKVSRERYQMTLQNESKQIFIVGEVQTCELLLKILGGESRQVKVSLSCFVVEIESPLLSSKITEIRKYYDFEHYLDRYLVAIPKVGGVDRLKYIIPFFELIASEYESVIDDTRNKDNIHKLLICLKDELAIFKPKLLDFGCGTGLSHTLSKEYSFEVIGYDRSNAMLSIASSAGMCVWSQETLNQQLEHTIDGCFASYVFHLETFSEDLIQVWRCLKIGGMVIGNFHKNKAVENFKNFIKTLGGEIYKPQSLPSSTSNHGTYLAAKKV